MYCSKTDIENYLLTTIDSSFNTPISSWIASVSKWIDNYTGRTFEEVNEVKKYDGNGKESLNVDDLISVDKIWFVANDATGDNMTIELASTDYYLYRDSSANANGKPYNRIVLNPNGNNREFPGWAIQNVWIKGNWGYSAIVPDDIKMVAVKLVSALVRQGKDSGDIKSFSEGDLSITYNDFQKTLDSDLSVKGILDWYKKKERIISFKAIRV